MKPTGKVTALLHLDCKNLETKLVVIDKNYDSK